MNLSCKDIILVPLSSLGHFPLNPYFAIGYLRKMMGSLRVLILVIHTTILLLMVATDTKIATQDDGSYEHCDYSLDGATVTFENISINTDSGLYRGYAGCNATYKNCVINGTPAERLNVTVDGVNVY